MTGVQQYALKLSQYLKLHFKGDIHFVTPKGIVHTPLAEKLNAQVIGNTNGFFWEQVELPFWLKKNGNPLLLNFGNVAPQYYSNQIITIHDLSTLEHPEWFSNKFSRAYKFILPGIVKTAKQIITVSEFTKTRLVDFLKIDPQKIHVIYNSINHHEKIPSPVETDPYFLSVGSFSGRKNFLTLINAFQKANLNDYLLKIRGDIEDKYRDDDIDNVFLKNPSIQYIEPLNYQAYLELICNAKALVNISLYEGFGMPNLEALSIGTPVICSDIEVFREICGDCATYVNPMDEASLTAILQAFSSTSVSDADKAKWKNRAALFSTEKEGKKLLDLIYNCLES